MKKLYKRIQKLFHLGTCPECGQQTLSSYDRGDDCSNCGYNVYYP